MICIQNSVNMINPNEKAKVDGTNQVTKQYHLSYQLKKMLIFNTLNKIVSRFV